MSKRKSLVILVAIILVIAALAVLAVNGVNVGRIYKIMPLHSAIKQGLDLTGGVSAVYQIANQEDVSKENISSAIEVFRTRLDAEGYTEATITQQGDDKIRIEIPINDSTGNVDPNVITEYLVATAKVTFVDPEGNIVFEGKDMVEVGVTTDESGMPAVGFTLNDQATKAFAESTETYLGQAISIYLDQEVVSSPTVNSVISGGSGIITMGDGSSDYQTAYEYASRLANQIRSGVMPVDLDEIEVRSISATLGEEALSLSVTAGAIGLLIVMAFMLVIYRMNGLVADIALCFYMILVLFAMATIESVQLTLPGIAGVILAIGMAVDANVIIFERINEELVLGKTLRTAVKAGFNRAFSAILDSNITTIIAAVVLLYFGTGTIKGFAMTLLIGIIASFFTAVLVSRGILTLLANIDTNPKHYLRIGTKLEPPTNLQQPGKKA